MGGQDVQHVLGDYFQLLVDSFPLHGPFEAAPGTTRSTPPTWRKSPVEPLDTAVQDLQETSQPRSTGAEPPRYQTVQLGVVEVVDGDW